MRMTIMMMLMSMSKCRKKGVQFALSPERSEPRCISRHNNRRAALLCSYATHISQGSTTSIVWSWFEALLLFYAIQCCRYSAPYRGRVYKWKFCQSVHLSVCVSVITSNSFPYSDSELTQPPPVDLSHATSPTVSNVPHPWLPCPPVNWSLND